MAHKHHLRIATRTNATMPKQGRVHGTVRPHQQVSLYVQARDSRWYLQAPSVGHGGHWAVDAVFGVDGAPSGTVYPLAAIVGKNPLKAYCLDQLPAGEWVHGSVVRA